MKTLNTKSYRMRTADGSPAYSRPSVRSNTDKKAFFIRVAIMVFAASIFIYAGSQLFMIFYKYYESDKIYSDVQNEILGTDDGNNTPTAIIIDNNNNSGEDSTAEPQTVEVFKYDHAKLVAKNPDAVGYIHIPSVNIRLPLVQGKDNDYYVTHAFDGSANRSGAIFMDYRITDKLNSTNIILHGHHMKNDGMFAGLKYYQNQSFYKTSGNEYFYIYTENLLRKYKIFSVHVDEPISPTYTFNFSTLEGLRQYAQDMKNISMYNTGVDVSGVTQVVTLSTCTATGDGRIIVQGMFVGEGILE